LHHRVGIALEVLRQSRLDDHLEPLAHHFLAAHRDPEAAAFYACRAATKALGQLSHEEAATWCERGLQALEGLDEGSIRCDLLISLAEACGRSGDVPRAREALAVASMHARAAGDASRVGRIALANPRGYLSAMPEPHEVPIVLLEEALAGLEADDSAIRARLLGRLAVGLYFTEERERGVALSRTAVEMAKRLGDDEALGHALMSLHLALQDPAHVEDRLALAGEIVEVARRHGNLELEVFGRFLPVADLLEATDVAAADAAMARCEPHLQRLQQPLLRLLGVQHRAMRALMAGSLTEGEALANDALQIAQAAGYHYAQVFGSLIFQLRWYQGRLGEHETRLTRYTQREPDYAGWRAALAMASAETGRLDEARLYFETIAVDEFAGCCFDHTWTVVMTTASEVCTALNDTRRAEILYELLLPFADRAVVLGRGVICVGSLARTLGLLATVLGRWNDADAHFRLADEVNRRMGAVPLVAWNQANWAQMLLIRGENGDTERARSLLAAAAATADDLGLHGLRPRLLSTAP
jgi:tetratricopeptide (TPR) repeat protein